MHEMEQIVLQGEPPDPTKIPSGCRFHPRCPYAFEECKTTDPAILSSVIPVGSDALPHDAACHLVNPPPAQQSVQ
jgi:oligopeptide/dipeptide ABC transporter ATP-binding protein